MGKVMGFWVGFFAGMGVFAFGSAFVVLIMVLRNERRLKRARKPLPRQDIDAGWNR